MSGLQAVDGIKVRVLLWTKGRKGSRLGTVAKQTSCFVIVGTDCAYRNPEATSALRNAGTTDTSAAGTKKPYGEHFGHVSCLLLDIERRLSPINNTCRLGYIVARDICFC